MTRTPVQNRAYAATLARMTDEQLAATFEAAKAAHALLDAGFQAASAMGDILDEEAQDAYDEAFQTLEYINDELDRRV